MPQNTGKKKKKERKKKLWIALENNYFVVCVLIAYLCKILANIFKQFARMKPTLPIVLVRYQDDNRNSKENINILWLYLKLDKTYMLEWAGEVSDLYHYLLCFQKRSQHKFGKKLFKKLKSIYNHTLPVLSLLVVL